MLGIGIFRMIGDFCTNVVFAPLNEIRHMDDWWMSNIFNAVFVLIGFVLFAYWVGQAVKFKREGTEDLSK